MTCARHHAIARTVDDFGWPLCYRCFAEAKAKADDVELEAHIRALRVSSVDALMQRLGWR